MCPFYVGTRNLNSPSYSPETGLYYVGINNSCMDVTFVSEEYRPGRLYSGIAARVKAVPDYDYVGEFVAFNPLTGQRAWERRFPGGAAMSAAALSTAGGIVFGGTSDRRFFALDADDGDLLWETAAERRHLRARRSPSRSTGASTSRWARAAASPTPGSMRG